MVFCGINVVLILIMVVVQVVAVCDKYRLVFVLVNGNVGGEEEFFEEVSVIIIF